MCHPPSRRTGVLSSIIVVLALAGLGVAQERQRRLAGTPSLVDDVIRVDVKVEPTDPSRLVVSAIVVDPTGLYKDPKLIRAVYETPPEDGFQDFFVLATPPTQTSQTERISLTVKSSWDRFREAAPWLRGARVHGRLGAVGVLIPKS